MDATPAGPPAIVVGLDCITGLQTARILAGRGVRVVGLANDPGHACCRTRAVEEVVGVDTSAPALIDVLASLAGRLDGAVVVPCTDQSVQLIAAGRDRLAHLRIALPDPGVADTLLRKDRFAEHAQAHGIPIPRTVVLRSADDLLQVHADLTFPVVLKPAVRSPGWEDATGGKVAVATDAETLDDLYRRGARWTDVVVAQEWVPGGDEDLVSCNTYVSADGRPLATFMARKLRQWPPHQGTSSLGEEVRDDEAEALALRVLATVDYHGLGYVECKRDRHTGRLVVIEPNIGRPTGRSAIAEAGGVELLATMYRDLAGLPLPDERTQRYVGAKWIHLRRDLQSAAWSWRAGELTLRQWARSLRGRKAYAVWSVTDPLPFLLDLWHTLQRRRSPVPRTEVTLEVAP